MSRIILMLAFSLLAIDVHGHEKKMDENDWRTFIMNKECAFYRFPDSFMIEILYFDPGNCGCYFQDGICVGLYNGDTIIIYNQCGDYDFVAGEKIKIVFTDNVIEDQERKKELHNTEYIPGRIKASYGYLHHLKKRGRK